MSGISGACFRAVAYLLHALGVGGLPSTNSAHIIHPNIKPIPCTPQADGDAPPPTPQLPPLDDLMLRALTAVFGMETNGRINKDKARQVVEKLGLVEEADQTTTNFDLLPPAAAAGDHGLEEQVAVEEVLGGGFMEDGSKRNELLRQAFRIFDEDGNGFIDALELKRVLQCLGLDNGWEMGQIDNMLKVVDLNFDGKVDFSEFEMMMS